MDTCEEPRRSWYLEFPCGKKATAWHNGRSMCRSCRSEALRAEAWHRRATEGGVLGWLVNAAPNIVIWGFFLVTAFVGRDLLWEFLRSEQGQLQGYFLFFAVVWVAIRAADNWLVQAWRRKRKGKKDKAHRGDDDQTVPLE
jgi:hypothetical protein